mgnify:FL=1
MQGDLTANPASVVSWTSTEGHIYSPTGTTQDIDITFNDGVTKNTCTIRVSMTNIPFTDEDWIVSITEHADSDSAFTIGTMDPAASGKPKFATATVTHTASGLTIDISGLLSQVDLSGAGK